MAFLADEPPTLCCWLPWNHTAGGNHNFGLVLYNGGTFYIDEGKPTPGLFDITLRNLREIPATAHFTVPRTYEMLLPHLRSDAVLRETFFRKLKLYFYAAAGLGQRFWDELRDLAVDACGEELLIVTGFGATETAPFALTTGGVGAVAGMIGLPCPGMEMKLAPVGTKKEARVRGPNITPGYWGDEAMTRAAFDEEGFYRLGDAMDFVDPADPDKGLMFDGRLAEDFKLSTGTWVSVGPLRSRILMQAAGYAQDVVIAGHDREFAAALVFPNVARCRELVADASPDAPASDILRHPAVSVALPERLRRSRAPGHRQLDVRVARRAPRRAALTRCARDHRQGLDQPEGRASEPRGARRGPLLHSPTRARHRLRGQHIVSGFSRTRTSEHDDSTLCD